MKSTYLLFYNPRSGGFVDAQTMATIRQFFKSKGGSVIYKGLPPDTTFKDVTDHAVLQQADRYIAAGGDGTVAAVASMAIEHTKPVAILPLGTGNVLSQALSIPTDLEPALELAYYGKQKTIIDAMKISEMYFFLQVSVGFLSKVMGYTPPEAKKTLKKLAYVAYAVSMLPKLKEYTLQVEYISKTRKIRTFELLIANANTLGSPNVSIAKNISIHDGYVNILSVTSKTWYEHIQLLGGITFNTEEKPYLKHIAKVKNVTISSSQPLPVHADGEVIGKTPVTINVIKNAVEFITS